MKKWIDQRGFQEEYGVSMDTQDKLRARGVAPPWFKVGHKVYYDRAELCQWVDQQQALATGKSQSVEAQPAKPDRSALDPALQTVLNTLALDDETRTRIAELIGGADDEG